MSPHTWLLCALLCVAEGDAPEKCSYTFLVPEQKIKGAICASQGTSLPDPERVTRMDVSDVREVVTKQRREIDTLRLVADVDGNLVNEMKLLRKESRNMNSRVTQLHLQLLHEIIRKRDNSLELVRLEARVLNATAEALRLSARYRELETRFSALAAVVNNQSALMGALEERCLRVYGGHGEEPQPPPLVQVVPENIPVYVPPASNEIHRSQEWVLAEGGTTENTPAPTGQTADQRSPPARGNVSSEGPFRDCWAALQAGELSSGTYLLQPGGARTPVRAWCEQDVDRGGWTVIQSRSDGSVSFFRDWESYKTGFGSAEGEHWLGLEHIYQLGKQDECKLLVELEDWTGKKVYAAYGSFHLEPESQSYRLRLGTYQGNAGDALAGHNGNAFTTRDRDRDSSAGNCAHWHKGGWWYGACAQANLNGVWYPGGVYRSRFQDGIFWADYGGAFYSMKSVRMMIRPVD